MVLGMGNGNLKSRKGEPLRWGRIPTWAGSPDAKAVASSGDLAQLLDLSSVSAIGSALQRVVSRAG
ncbi:MAG: hypothetical protein KME38_11130 [Spirirestis rafaelensis WJT71-NPBG6]|jgi:hypothetical protein|nr:hypothetical protein [Spirirestis rafaelensis WJT71-NPBG6]